MRGDKENGTWPARPQASYQGETLQVFVFFKGRYLGYQCYVQDRVTAGGRQDLDLYLPACNPEDGYWSFEICGGTLVAWLSPLGGRIREGSKPARRAVEPLDVFPLGPYRLQVKMLKAAGFVDQYADLAAEPVSAPATEAEPGGRQARPEPEPIWDDSDATCPQTHIEEGVRHRVPSKSTYPEETLEERRTEDLAEPPLDPPNHGGQTRLCREQAQCTAETVQLPEAAGEDPPCPLPGLDQKEGGETSLSEPFRDEACDESDRPAAYFPLLREIFRSCKTAAPISDPARRALEVVRFRGSDLRDVTYLEGKSAYTLRKDWPRRLWKKRGGPRPNSLLVSLAADGCALLHVPDGVTGRLHSKSGAHDLRDLARATQPGTSKRPFRPVRRAAQVELAPDAWAVLRVDPDRYLVRYVARRPGLPARPLRPHMTRSQAKILSASIVSHIVLILLVGLTVPKGTIGGTAIPDRFAKVDPSVLKTFKKPEPLKPDKPIASPLPAPQNKPQATPTPKAQPPKPAETAKAPSRFQPTARPNPGAERAMEPQKQVDVAQTGLLAALGPPSAAGAAAKASGQSRVLLAAVTSLDAVAVPSDSTTFNLAGIAGKLGTSEIQVPTGVGQAIRTVGAQELLKSSQGTMGALASKGTGAGQVKAVVREPPKATISIRGGMSREAVLEVVNAHLDEIRDCYERELLHSPGLTGKIVLEWLIREDGSVSYAKVAFTNIGHSSDLHLCVQAQVATWKFPKPTNGHEVLVTFPFLFENLGF